MKKLFSLVLCFGILLALAVPASASNARLLEYDHIDTITANLNIDRFWGIATCDGSIAASGSYPVSIVVYLQQSTDNGWQTVQWWTAEDDDGTAVASGRCAIAKGYQYRTYTVGTVYDENGNVIDSASASYSEPYN